MQARVHSATSVPVQLHRIQQEIEENQLHRARVSTSDHTHCLAAMTRVPVDSFPVNQVQRSLR